MMIKDRSTIDIVVLMLTMTIGLVLLLIVIGMLALRLYRPDIDINKGAESVGNILTTVVGALVGLIGGRAAGRLEANNSQQKS